MLTLPPDEETRKAVVAAYALLARRPFSRKELRGRLGRDFESADVVDAALDWLESRRLLDDRRLADDAVRAAVTRKGWGRRKVEQWLQGRGIEADLAAEAAGGIDPEEEARQAAALAARQRARGKQPEQIFRFLVARGFPTAVARRAALDEEG